MARSARTLPCVIFLLALCVRSSRAQAPPAAAALPPAESKARIALLHMVNDVWFFQDLASVTKRNKRRYAARQGYEFVSHDKSGTSGMFAKAECNAPGAVRRGSGADVGCFVADSTFQLDKRAPTFGKIKLALAACVGRADYWLLWTDADALVFNQARSLLDIVDDAYDIMVASDWFMINAGVLLLRCSEWNIEFLQKVYEAREFDEARALDQSALASFFENDDVKPHVKHVPKWLINGTSLERMGSPCVHCARAWHRPAAARPRRWTWPSYVLVGPARRTDIRLILRPADPYLPLHSLHGGGRSGRLHRSLCG
jgi:hypothetical protein